MVEKNDWIQDLFFGSRDLYGTTYNAIGTSVLKDPEKDLSGVLKILDAEPGCHILDWCGGGGRHSVPLAKRGYKVTLLDHSIELLNRAEIYARSENAELEFVRADFRETPAWIQADFAINLLTSGLGYLGEENDVVALTSLKAALKPGAKILIDTMNLFWLSRNFIPNSWVESSNGAKKLLEKRRFDHWTNTVHTAHMYMNSETGEHMESRGYHCVYSPADLSRVLKTAGFTPIDLLGDLDGSTFSFASKRVVMTARRGE